MKIALYLNNLWNISATARIANILSKEFSKLGHDVIFIINKTPIDINTGKKVIVLKNRGDLGRAKEIPEVLIREKVDICLGFMRPQSIVLSLAKVLKGKNLKTKLVGSIHGNDNYSKLNKPYILPYRFLLKFLFSKLDGFIAVSKGVKDDISEAFFLKENFIRVINNPIDIDDIKIMSREPIEEEFQNIFLKNVIINVSRLEEEKGLHHLLNIFKKVLNYKDANLVIVGDGRLRDNLENQAKELNIDKNVYFLGWQENPFKFIAKSKILTMTSILEGFGMVLVESFALGIPAIAFKTRGGHVEVLENCCPLIDYPDENKFADELVKILENEKYYSSLKEKAEKRVKDFSAEKIAKEYLEYFGSLT
jgi:glycosyltransferase involved in cell wall biosynthesis